MASNPMNASIKISNLHVQVLDTANSEVPVDGISVEVVDDFELAPLETREVRCRVFHSALWR
jgi:hypothetical protein